MAAEVKIKFSAETAAAQKQLDELRKVGEATKKRLAEGGEGDRRADLEALRTAKEQLAAAEAEKKEIQEKIKLQAQTVKQAQAAVSATAAGSKEHSAATRELERQLAILSNLKSTGAIKGNIFDTAQENVGLARKQVRHISPIAPRVNAAPAVSGFARIRAAASSTVARIKSGFAAASAGVSRAFTGMRAAAGAALAYVGINSVKQVINELDNLSKHARSLDIDTASFQKLKYAADSNNVSFEQVESSIGKMKRALGEAANGSAEAQKKLAMLGLTVKDFEGKTTAEQFDLIAQSITSIQDPAQRTAAAMKWFEEGGAKMLDFLKNYKQQGDELAARGAIIDDAQLKAAEDFNQSLTNISTTLKGLAVNSGFIGQMKKLAELVDFAFSGKGEQMEKKAAAVGIYNRKTGAAFAAEKIIASGNYTPEQQERIRKAAGRYGAGLTPAQMSGGMGPGRVAVADYHKEYSLIDEELQKRGMGVLARQKSKGFWQNLRHGEYYFGDDTTVTATQTEEEKRAAAEKLKQEKEARAAEAARKAAAQKAAAEAAAKAAEKEKSGKMDAEIKALEERYRLQQMINQGKGKEAAIEEALNRARKQAEGLGTKLTAEQEQRIRTVTAASYDLSHPAKSAGTAAASAKSAGTAAPAMPFKSPIQDTYATYGLRSVGGMIAGASRAGTFSTDYAQRSAQTLANIQTQLANIDQKLPGRTEATPVRVQF